MPTTTSPTSTSDSSQPTQQPKSDTMPPLPPSSPSTIPLTLILAATPSLGIGRAGGLPWPMLKKEMAWFTRVTKRVPSPTSSTSTSSSDVAAARKINAVIMGRKTWDSIPPRFRPLKDRLNVVVTRDVSGFLSANNIASSNGETKEGPVVVGSLPAAIEALRSEGEEGREVSRAWVIGGASIYTEALGLKETNRVVLTKIKREYECDAFFPVDLEGGEGGWRRVGREGLEEWVGEEVPEGEVVEGDVAFEFCLFERD